MNVFPLCVHVLTTSSYLTTYVYERCVRDNSVLPQRGQIIPPPTYVDMFSMHAYLQKSACTKGLFLPDPMPAGASSPRDYVCTHVLKPDLVPLKSGKLACSALAHANISTGGDYLAETNYDWSAHR